MRSQPATLNPKPQYKLSSFHSMPGAQTDKSTAMATLGVPLKGLKGYLGLYKGHREIFQGFMWFGVSQD